MMYSTLEPSFHPLFYKGKIYGLFHEHCPGSNILLFEAKKVGIREAGSMQSVKFSFVQLILFILVLILCPLPYRRDNL